MNGADELSPYRQLERAVARALRAGDPAASLAEAARDTTLPPELRAALGAAATNVNGLRMSALLVARLRFERLVQGSRSAAAWFEENPAAFAAAFRRYHESVAPTGSFPWEEAHAFEHWASSDGPGAAPATGGQPGNPARPR